MLRERIGGLFRAIVVDNNDPEGLLRIRVQIPSILGSVTSNWAWPSVPNIAGQTVPDYQAPVWVAFEDGDIDRPVWLGTWVPVRFPNAPQTPQNYILTGGTNVLAVPAATAFAMQAVGDTFNRFEARTSGELRWGPGVGAVDVILGRTGPGVLTTTASSLVTPTGAIAQAAVANLPADIAGINTDIAGLTSAVAQRALDSTVVHLAGAETISGVKTFSADPVLNNGAVPQAAVANLGVDLAARALDSTVVHLAGDETVTGIKTFSANPVFNVDAVPQAAVVNLGTDLAARALDSTVVHLAGAETITGIKTFSTNPVFNNGALQQSKVANLVTDLAAKAADSTVVHLAGTETVTGAKTFSTNPVFNDGAIPQAKVTNLVTDLAAKAADSTVVHLAGTETITGAKTFSAGATSTVYAASGLTGAVQATRYVGGTTSGAPTSGTFAVGDYVVARNAKVWICTVAGTPGTWVAPFSMGTLGYAQVTANQTAITTEVDLTGLSVTVTTSASRRISIIGHVPFYRSVADGSTWMYIKEGTTALQLGLVQPARASESVSMFAHAVITPSAGTHTYKLTMLQASGTGSTVMSAQVVNAGYILVQDIGAV